MFFLSFSVHFNESALIEMFIWTVRSFYVFMKNSVLTDKNQSDLSFLWKRCFSFSLCKCKIPSCADRTQRLLFSGHMLLFSGHRHSYFLEISILVLLVPSDAGDGSGDGNFPTTLPAWPRPRGYHAQGSNIPFGESLTLIYIYIYIYIGFIRHISRAGLVCCVVAAQLQYGRRLLC